uniref:Uncharacterized protein n=1 Tax=Arundo donax TaxID=35708 RepID=A0A0A9HVX7_ARUDO
MRRLLEKKPKLVKIACQT